MKGFGTLELFFGVRGLHFIAFVFRSFVRFFEWQALDFDGVGILGLGAPGCRFRPNVHSVELRSRILRHDARSLKSDGLQAIYCI